MPIKNTLKIYQEIALKKGGKCLSTKYLGFNSKLKFECINGHIWETNAVNISGKNRWCPQCAPNKKLSLNDAINFASQFDGYCLSLEYKNITSKLKWKCKYGHVWFSTFVSIKNSKGWCPQCTGKLFSENIVRRIFEMIFNKKFIKIKPKWLKMKNSYLELDGYCEELSLAFEHNGIQHYKLTSFSKTQTILNKIKNRDRKKIQLCKNNGVKLVVVPDIFNKLGINNVINFIFKQLNIPYNSVKIDIQQILNEERTSSYVNKTSEIIEYATKKGGKCLSQYISRDIKLQFQCEKEHIWWARWDNVKHGGTWCPICYKIKRGIINE